MRPKYQPLIDNQIQLEKIKQKFDVKTNLWLCALCHAKQKTTKKNTPIDAKKNLNFAALIFSHK